MRNWIQFAWKWFKLRPELAFSSSVLPVAELSEVFLDNPLAAPGSVEWQPQPGVRGLSDAELKQFGQRNKWGCENRTAEGCGNDFQLPWEHSKGVRKPAEHQACWNSSTCESWCPFLATFVAVFFGTLISTSFLGTCPLLCVCFGWSSLVSTQTPK